MIHFLKFELIVHEWESASFAFTIQTKRMQANYEFIFELY